MTRQRKFTAYLLTLLAMSLLAWENSVSGAEYVGALKICLLVFVGGNAAEHFSGK